MESMPILSDPIPEPGDTEPDPVTVNDSNPNPTGIDISAQNPPTY